MPPRAAPLPPQAASLLAVAARLLGAGRTAQAIAPLRAAALLAPGNAAILHDLGLACLECGQLRDAMAALRASVAADPDFTDSHLRLGIALEATGSLQAALDAYGRAASLPDAQYRAGELHDSLGQTDAAMHAYRQAAATAPGTMLGRIAAAKAALAAGQPDAAERLLRAALSVEADNAVALDALGTLLAEAGRFAEAHTLLLRAAESAPARAGSYYEAVRCRRMVPADAPLVTRMRAAAAAPGLEPAQRSRVHLALGKAAEDVGEHETAMRHFDAAEALRNEACAFDPAAFAAHVDRLIGCFTADMLQGATQADATPIFIVGLPRSGTTLLEQILSAHPHVRAGGELPFWNARGQMWAQNGGGPPTPAFLAKAAADYLRVLHGIAPDSRYVTDKMPLNFQWAGLIHLAFPGATIIHCRRQPMDTAMSIHKTHFNPRMAFPTGGAALVAYVRAYLRLMAHWRRVLPPACFIEIDYESLVTDPAPHIRHLLAACGLTWDESCLHPEANDRPVRTPSKFQAREPIHPGAVGGWRAYAPWLGPLAALLDEPPGEADNILTK